MSKTNRNNFLLDSRCWYKCQIRFEIRLDKNKTNKYTIFVWDWGYRWRKKECWQTCTLDAISWKQRQNRNWPTGEGKSKESLRLSWSFNCWFQSVSKSYVVAGGKTFLSSHLARWQLVGVIREMIEYGLEVDEASRIAAEVLFYFLY